jgi:acyl-coenzyme A thioesterase PaaI-like protein
MDSATAIALRELRGAGATLHSSIEMNTTYLAPVPPGQEIVIEGRVLQMEPVVAFAEASATLRESGELVATARVTFAIQQERS